MKTNRNNVDLSALLEHENGRTLYEGQQGYVVCTQSGNTIMTDITDGAALHAVLCALALQNVESAVVKSRSAQRTVRELFGLVGSDVWTQWVYCMPEPPAQPACDIRPLQPCHAPLAAAHYHLFEDTEPYITSRIAAGRMWGVFDGGSLAGFIGTHVEGSMGILEVLPEYRRRGYGLALEQFLIAWHLERGWTPFGHVIDGNEASIRLQKKAGLVCAELPTIWMY